MQVIGAGYGRTGTMSLKAALEQLGAGPCFHMIDLIRHETRVELWEAAVAGEEVYWHEVFEGWEATVDWPGCSFYQPLMEAFPDAKVLLTVRDPDAWYESCRKTIHAAQAAIRGGDLEGGTETPPSPAVMNVIAPLIWDGEFEGRFEDRAFALDVFNRTTRRCAISCPPTGSWCTRSRTDGSRWRGCSTSRCPTRPSRTSTTRRPSAR